MIDTGNPMDLFLNNARVKIEARENGTGTAGSGQKFKMFLAEEIPPVTIAEQTWKSIQNVYLANHSFVEQGIGTPPLLGFLGYGFFKDCEFDLDYSRRLLIFRKLNEKGNPVDALPSMYARGEKIAELNFTTSEDVPQIPVVHLSMDDVPVKLALDTGRIESSVPKEFIEYLLEQEQASRFLDLEQNGGQIFYRLSGLKVASMEFSLDWVEPLSLQENEQFDVKEAQLILTGYPFLKQFRSVWNYQKKKITLYAI